MTVQEILNSSGMTTKAVSDLTGIPYRSLQNWELGDRTPPDYVVAYLEQVLLHATQRARVRLTDSIKLETMTDKGDWVCMCDAPVERASVPVSMVMAIGHLANQGYKIEFLWE